MSVEITPSRRELLQASTERLEDSGVEDARRNAEWMLCEVLACNRASLYSRPDERVPAEAAARFEEFVRRRARREPLQYILGHTEFFGLSLLVGPEVLIPRPETEQVVEHALECIRAFDHPVVLDVATGSGCIALAIAHERPDARVAACDVSEGALRVARENARRLSLQVDFFRADILRDSLSERSRIDLLVSNPPYVTPLEAPSLQPEVVAFEPHLALFSNEDPLQFYRQIAKRGMALIRPGGWLVFETHADHATGVRDLLTGAGYENTAALNDLAGHPRIVSASVPLKSSS